MLHLNLNLQQTDVTWQSRAQNLSYSALVYAHDPMTSQSSATVCPLFSLMIWAAWDAGQKHINENWASENAFINYLKMELQLNAASVKKRLIEKTNSNQSEVKRNKKDIETELGKEHNTH